MGQQGKRTRASSPVVISVVVPTYGRCAELEATLSPLLRERNVGEIVVVVDGSFDGSWELLTEISKEYERVRVILQSRSGRTAARQRGFLESSGGIVIFLDDDVLLDSGFAEKHAALA